MSTVTIWGKERSQGKEREGGTWRDRRTYETVGCGAESSTTIVPIIVSEFINLDSLPIRRRMRHGLCRHRQRFVRFRVGDQAMIVLEKIGRKV